MARDIVPDGSYFWANDQTNDVERQSIFRVTSRSGIHHIVRSSY